MTKQRGDITIPVKTALVTNEVVGNIWSMVEKPSSKSNYKARANAITYTNT